MTRPGAGSGAGARSGGGAGSDASADEDAGPSAEPPPARLVVTVLFDDFELLDVAGPLEVFAGAGGRFRLALTGPSAGPVASAQGPALVAGSAYANAPSPDLVVVPGGIGTRRLAGDAGFLAWLAGWAAPAELVTSVCTGSGLLAAAGLLDGRRATSNKRAFEWARGQGPAVTWVRQARWVEDGDRWTSSGVTAGIDMALAIVARLAGTALAEEVAARIEHEWHRDPSVDPFAAAG